MRLYKIKQHRKLQNNFNDFMQAYLDYERHIEKMITDPALCDGNDITWTEVRADASMDYLTSNQAYGVPLLLTLFELANDKNFDSA